MTARLELRVQKAIMGEQVLSGALAEVIPTESESAPALRGIVIPVSFMDSEPVDVAAGRYLVRAYLPSGALLSRYVDAEEGKTTPVVLEAENTPHEWLGWQGLMQQRAPAALEEEADGQMHPQLVVIDAPPLEDVWHALHDGITTSASLKVDDVIAMLHGTPTAQLSTQKFFDERTSSFIVETPSLSLGPLRYGIVERGGTVDLVSLPVPWVQEDRSGAYSNARLDIAVPRSTESHVGTAVRDPELGALLGFVASGRLGSAKTMSRPGGHVRQRLLMALGGKLQNPFAATAGAYLLLQTEPEAGDWQWMVENLASWFPWLPDGPALLGAMRLRFGKGDNDVAEARTAFMSSLSRGLPVFAPVLRLLLDGISTLVGDPDADAGPLEAKLPWVRAVASVLAPEQPLTTLHWGART